MIGLMLFVSNKINFSPEEAATPEALAERLETICDTFLIAEIDGTVACYISLTCHDYLITYYEMNGFIDEGESKSNHGDSIWYNMVWENPEG